MDIKIDEAIKAISDAKPSVDKICDAFLKLDQAISTRAVEIQIIKQRIQDEARNGSRLTKHRFSL